MGRFFAFLVYSFLFLFLGGSVISYYLEFSPFAFFSWKTREAFVNPFLDWYILYNRFQYGRWAVDSAENLFIFLIFIFFFPLWISGWFLIRRIHWKKVIFKPFACFKGHKIAPNKVSIAKNTMGRPIAMRRMQGFGGASVMTMDVPEQNNMTGNIENEENIDMPNVNAIDEKSPVVTALQKEQLRVLGEKYGYDLFENVRLDDYNAPFVFATDTLALVTAVLVDDREWIADEVPAEDNSEPTWFSSEGLITSPFYRMTETARLLKEKEPDSEIIPVVVVAAGSILNVSAVAEQWKEKNGFVVLWDKGEGEGLPTLEDLLQAKSQGSIGYAVNSAEDDFSDEQPVVLQENADINITDEENIISPEMEDFLEENKS